MRTLCRVPDSLTGRSREVLLVALGASAGEDLVTFAVPAPAISVHCAISDVIDYCQMLERSLRGLLKQSVVVINVVYAAGNLVPRRHPADNAVGWWVVTLNLAEADTETIIELPRAFLAAMYVSLRALGNVWAQGSWPRKDQVAALYSVPLFPEVDTSIEA